MTVDNTTSIQRTLDGYIRSQKIVTQAQNEKQKHHRGMDELLDLKIRTAQLASNIFNLLLDGGQMAPPIPSRATWEQDIAKMVPFDNQTVLLYARRSFEFVAPKSPGEDRLSTRAVLLGPPVTGRIHNSLRCQPREP